MKTVVERERRFNVLDKVGELINARKQAGRHPKAGVAELKLVIELLGSRATLCRADNYFSVYGRSQGYDIPPLAYSGSGEIREMLRDEKVGNVREWYAKIGVPEELLDRLGEFQMVVPVNRTYQHRCYFIAPTWDEVDPVYARRLALHLVGFCLSAVAPSVPEGILAGEKLF